MQLKPSQLASLRLRSMPELTSMDRQDTLAGFQPSLVWRSISSLLTVKCRPAAIIRLARNGCSGRRALGQSKASTLDVLFSGERLDDNREILTHLIAITLLLTF